MATLEKIRNQAGLLVVVVGLALFAFIIGDFLSSGSSYFREDPDQVALVNGTPINMQEYQYRIDEMTNIYKMQSQVSNVPEEVNGQIRQSVYEAMVQEIVMKDAVDKLGIRVTSDELFDMVQGENISPMVQQFPFFMDPQTGAYSRARALGVLKTIEDIESAPMEERAQIEQVRQYWLFWERNMKSQRIQDKYMNLLTKAIVANPLDAKSAYEATRQNADIVYAMQSYATIPDSTISVSDSEIKKLYNQRKEQYKQSEMRTLDYIVVDIRPSQDDYDAVREDLEKAKAELIPAGSDVAEVVNAYSEVLFTDAYASEAALDENMIAFVSAAEIGAVEGPIFYNQGYRLMKLVDKKIDADSVKLSQISFFTQGGLTEESIASLADSLLNVLKAGGDFEELAGLYSMDQMAAEGGDFGWFTEAGALRTAGDNFRDAIFGASVGEPQIFKDAYSTHIIKITEKTAPVPKYKLAYISQEVTAGSKTQNEIYGALNQFVANNNSVEKIAAAAKDAGYELRQGVNVAPGDRSVGSIADSRQVIRWAFEGTKKNEISRIFESKDNFVLAIRRDASSEGYQAIETIAPMLSMEIRTKKKGDEIVKQLKDKNLTSIESYAQAMGSVIDTVRFINMNTSRITGIGLEPILNTKVTYAPLNQISEPIAGNNGVYVFNVFHREQDTGTYNEKTEIQTLESAIAYSVGYMATQALRDKAVVKDNRIRFE